eukprot:g3795.t1
MGLFLIICAMLFIGFTMSAYLSFGSRLYQFSTLARTVTTLFRAIIGSIDSKEIQSASPTFGSIFLVAYITIFVLVVCNILLAITVEAWIVESKFEKLRREKERESGSLFMLMQGENSYLVILKSACRNLVKIVCCQKKGGRMTLKQVIKRIKEWKDRDRETRAIHHINVDTLIEIFGQAKYKDMCFELMLICKNDLIDRAEMHLLEEKGADFDKSKIQSERDITDLKALQRAFKDMETAQRLKIGDFENRLDDLLTSQKKGMVKLRDLDAVLTSLSGKSDD